MHKLQKLVVFVALTGFAVGCGYERSGSVLIPSSVTPSTMSGGANNALTLAGGNNAASSLVGTWSQAATYGAQAITSLPSPNSCTEFVFTMTSQNATSATGTFSARCPGDLTLTGAVSGQLGGATIPMVFTGVATAPGSAACPFTLNGNGVPTSATELRIDYTGTTCLGPVTGNVTMRLSPPAPPAAPTPAPTPAAPTAPAPSPSTPSGSDPLMGCGALVGGEPIKVIECIHDRLNAPHTVEGAFEVTKRVAWAYRNEGVGLLLKPGGENIVSWKGRSFAAARICLPDGKIYKVLTDVPTTNGPSLQDNGYVDRSLYVPAIDPNS